MRLESQALDFAFQAAIREAVGKNPRLTQGEASDKATMHTMRCALDQQRACKVRLINYRGGSNNAFWNCLSVRPRSPPSLPRDL